MSAACDPWAEVDSLRSLGLHRCDTLEELLVVSDVVTLHAPLLGETEGMITGSLIASMKPNATFINTARGALVRDNELIEVLIKRPDLTAVLDVTWPEPPVAESLLFQLPNVVLTPHIAGSVGREAQRMADLMIEEFLLWKMAIPRDMESVASRWKNFPDIQP